MGVALPLDVDSRGCVCVFSKVPPLGGTVEETALYSMSPRFDFWGVRGAVSLLPLGLPCPRPAPPRLPAFVTASQASRGRRTSLGLQPVGSPSTCHTHTYRPASWIYCWCISTSRCSLRSLARALSTCLGLSSQNDARLERSGQAQPSLDRRSRTSRDHTFHDVSPNLRRNVRPSIRLHPRRLAGRGVHP